MRDHLPLETRLFHWTRRIGTQLLQVSVGVVYLWFGALKLFPGASPATELIVTTYPFLPERLFLPFLGVWEVVIGVGYLSGIFLRVTMVLMVMQMLGAMSPIILNPAAVFVRIPFVLTIEGQYIVKNVVLLAAALVIVRRFRARLPGKPRLPSPPPPPAG